MTIEEFIKKTLEKGFTNIQITEKTGISSSVYLIDKEIDSYQDDYSKLYSIKAEYKKKTVKLATEFLAEEIIDLLLKKYAVTDSNYEDDYLEKSTNILMNKPLEFDILKEIDELKKVPSLREKYPQVKNITLTYEESYVNTRIVNSNGVDISTDNYTCTYMVDMSTEKDGVFTSFDDMIISTEKGKINFKNVCEEAIKKLLIIADKKKIKTGKYPVLIDRRVMSRLVASFGDMLFAEKIRNKLSCLNDKLDEKEFSDKLSIIEDPTNKKYPGYKLFDDEGTKTYKKDIIKKGVIKTYLYNIKEAKMGSTKSTGNSYQDGVIRNMYVIPGKKNITELLKDLNNGIYIVDYMSSGGTTVNSVNGDISLQVFGFVVKDGKLKSGIEASILTTSIFELLSNIREIGNDLVFTSMSSASPSMIIDDISIAR